MEIKEYRDIKIATRQELLNYLLVVGGYKWCDNETTKTLRFEAQGLCLSLEQDWWLAEDQYKLQGFNDKPHKD